jgi:pilus assembly protein Flp/PilA
MTYAMRLVRRCLGDERGATAIEYGLLASLVALAIVGALTGLGTSLVDLFQDPELTTALQ